MKKLKLLFMSLIATFSMMAVPSMAYAQSTEDVCEGVAIASGQTDCDTAGADTTVKNAIRLAIQIFQMIVGVISVFTLIIAGLGYITSGGDSGKTKIAKDRILYSAIGLMVVVLAQVIVSFVLNRVSSI